MLGLLGELALGIVVVRVKVRVVVAPVSELALVGINCTLEDIVADLHRVFSATRLTDRASGLTFMAVAIATMAVGGDSVMAWGVFLEEVERSGESVLDGVSNLIREAVVVIVVVIAVTAIASVVLFLDIALLKDGGAFNFGFDGEASGSKSGKSQSGCLEHFLLNDTFDIIVKMSRNIAILTNVES